jgi:hypothetical protein
MPKLTISAPMATVMTVLPSQFDEALRNPRSMGPTCLSGRERARLTADSAKGHHRIDIIKWPLPGRNLERAGEFGPKPRFKGQNRRLELKGALC